MLTLLAEQQECLWDEALPIEVRELPEDLAALDRLLDDPAVLVTDRGAVPPRGDRGAAGGVDRRAADDRDGDLRQVDGAQGSATGGGTDR